MEVMNIQFHENPSSGSWADTRRYKEGRTDTTKLRGAFRHIHERDTKRKKKKKSPEEWNKRTRNQT
jgi:hypothetical protein